MLLIGCRLVAILSVALILSTYFEYNFFNVMLYCTIIDLAVWFIIWRDEGRSKEISFTNDDVGDKLIGLGLLFALNFAVWIISTCLYVGVKSLVTEHWHLSAALCIPSVQAAMNFAGHFARMRGAVIKP